MPSITVNNPYDGSVVAEIPKQSARDVERALTNAYELFNDRDKWLPAYQRIDILEKTIAAGRSANQACLQRRWKTIYRFQSRSAACYSRCKTRN